MIIWFCVVVLVLLLVIWGLDIWYLARVGIPYLYIVLGKTSLRDVLKTHTLHSVVMPVDLDYMGHMNNARYLREADIARCHFLFRSKMLEVLQSLGSYIVMTANCCRFRRALGVFERFDIQTRILGWDERTLYLEQLFVQPSNGFVFATVIGRYNVMGTSPAVLMERIAGKKVESPELPEELLHWIKYNKLSSQRLRAASELQSELRNTSKVY